VNTNNLIDSIVAEDFEAADAIFNILINQAIKEALEVEKVKVASQIFKK
jgi:hypothetical protein